MRQERRMGTDTSVAARPTARRTARPGRIGSVIGACLAIGLGWTAAPAAAAPCAYTGPAGGSWTTAANWSCAAVPGAADDVTIADGDDVTLGSAVTVASLTLTGDGIRRGTGAITVTGAFTWSGGDLLGGGQVIVAPTGSLMCTTSTPGSTIAHQVINRSANAQIIGASFGGNVSGAFVNEGTLVISGAALLGPTFSNASGGVVNVNAAAGTLVRVDRLTNNGVFNVNSGTLHAGSNNITDSGDWNVAAGARLDFTMINGLVNPTRTSSGDITVNGGTLGFGFGLVTFTTGTVTFSGATPGLDIMVNNVVFNNVTVAPGTTLNQTGFGFQTVNGTLTNQGRIRATVQSDFLNDTQLFGLTGVEMTFANKAALTSMVVERVDANHPNVDAFTGTGRHWIVTPTGTFNASVTLPHAIAPASAASVCRYTGTGTVWNCVASSATASAVTRAGITSGGDFAVGNNAPAPPAPTIHTRYLAEGATGSFFDTSIALLNPTAEVAETTLKFLKQDGTVVTHALSIPALTRATVNPETLAGLEGASIATVIESTQPVVADRTMRWDATGYGSHAETSIASPLTTWYLAEGATTGRFNLYYLIQNPGTQAAEIQIRYLLPAPAAPVIKTYTIAANSRHSIYVNDEAPELGEAEISAVVTSTNSVPVIVERAMYLDANNQLFGAGHASAALANPSTSWFFAEGATGPFFNMFLLIANPNAEAAAIEARYLLTNGQVVTKTYSVAANSRFTIHVHAEGPELASAAVSTTLTSTNGVPVLAERAMWWPSLSLVAGDWQEGHNSAGSTQTGQKWALADGEDGGAFATQTFVLIANTSAFAGQARVTVHFEDGTSAQLANPIPLEPNSRTTVQIGAEIPQAVNRRFGTIVESLGATPAQIVVERAMYSNATIAGVPVVWAAGTNVVGTRLDSAPVSVDTVKARE
jgi:phage baseplate assembly protein gpV